MTSISVLEHDDAIQLDNEHLNALYSQLGETNADSVVSRALEELANRLSLIERSFYRNDLDALTKASKGLVGIADQIGMPDVAHAATNVSELAQTTDHPALAATLARLVRIGDRSLAAIWELQDMNGVV